MADVSMVFVGDTYVDRQDPDSAFKPNMRYFQGADILFCNLETVVADEKYVPADDPSDGPRTDEWMFPAYLRAGFNVMNIANNPAMMHGLAPYQRSLDVLDAAGIAHGGGGRTLAEARMPAIIEKNGTKVAFVCRTTICAPEDAATEKRGGVARFRVATAYEFPPRHRPDPGLPPIIHTIPNAEDRAALEEDLRSARAQADFVVASWHWGLSPTTGATGALSPYQTDMGRACIDAGADLVIGHHPHLLQPIEVYKGRPIVYSLANYVHDRSSMARPGRRFTTMLLRGLVHAGKLTELSFVPGRMEGNGPPAFSAPREAVDIVELMREISAPFGTAFEVGKEDVRVVLQ